MYECCVCKSSRQDAILHHFPRTEKRLMKWLKCLNRDNLKKLSPEELSNVFVCQKHFEKRFITPKSRLIGSAYPCLFTEDEISSGIPSQDNAENMDIDLEHSYSRKRHFDHTYFQREPLKEVIASSSSESQNVPGPSQISPPKQDLVNPVIIEPVMNEAFQASGLDTVRIAKDPKPMRRRLITKVKDLLPTCKSIYKEYKKSKQQADFHRRAKRALQFNKKMSFEKLTNKMNPYHCSNEGTMLFYTSNIRCPFALPFYELL
ncbi:uncharacterized protein LOC113231920 [Hyposmocoma kahamanoa]|uniref:uncharacterized protein LOC113231920 n=1 Tax=Hyposmocoma kahamanoa TaxID=1477025 RepID=UPI000E6D780B|nr:uncharacterized protein LOC113231920 [Hyposmocoma kahamanoa]